MKPFKIPKIFLETIFKQAETEYPRECCGMILGPIGNAKALSQVKPCKNSYDVYRELDSENFPRDARTAYFIDSAGLLKIHKEARASGEEVRIIYHSHIDKAAYFSDEDIKMALSEGEPAYPGVEYLVVSVLQKKAAEANLFCWNSSQKKFAPSVSVFKSA